MKQPDLLNTQPIDKLKFVLGNVMDIRIKQEILTCYINHDKINFDKIDSLPYNQQEQYEVILDRIIDRNKFLESKYKDGTEEITVKLKDIGDMSKAR